MKQDKTESAQLATAFNHNCKRKKKYKFIKGLIQRSKNKDEKVASFIISQGMFKECLKVSCLEGIRAW